MIAKILVCAGDTAYVIVAPLCSVVEARCSGSSQAYNLYNNLCQPSVLRLSLVRRNNLHAPLMMFRV